MNSNKNLIELVQVDGKELAIERQSENCWVNLTEMAKHFGKRPVGWLSTQYVKDYLQSLADKINEQSGICHFGSEQKDVCPFNSDQSHVRYFGSDQSDVCHFTPITPEDLIIVRKGGRKGEAGTWCTDYRIAMRFAQWLDTRFSVEVDTLLVRIANGELLISNNGQISLGGEDWVSSDVYCKVFGKSMNSFYGLKANYPLSFCNWRGAWYMSRELFNMKEKQMQYEQIRMGIRSQGDKRQLTFQFAEPNGKEG